MSLNDSSDPEFFDIQEFESIHEDDPRLSSRSLQKSGPRSMEMESSVSKCRASVSDDNGSSSELSARCLSADWDESMLGGDAEEIPFSNADILQSSTDLKEDITLQTLQQARLKWDSSNEDQDVSSIATTDVEQENGWRSLFRKRTKNLDPHKLAAKQSASQNKIKVKTHKKSKKDFAGATLSQEFKLPNTPAIWTMEFSHDGNYLAVGTADGKIRLWLVLDSPAYHKYMETGDIAVGDAVVTSPRSKEEEEIVREDSTTCVVNEDIPLLTKKPVRILSGHTSDVVDLSWSSTNFLLSASLDKTVRLWHVSKETCICKYKHPDLVTSVAFHPSNCRIFNSGTYDGKVRVWNILSYSVDTWAQADAPITSCCFSPNGKLFIAGLNNGSCIFYESKGLRYFTQVDTAKKKGRKVNSISFDSKGRNILINTCDSTAFIISMDYKIIERIFRGHLNADLPIQARFSDQEDYIICGSEDSSVFIWDYTPRDSTMAKSRKTLKITSFEYLKNIGKGSQTTACQFVPSRASNFVHPSTYLLIGLSDGDMKVVRNKVEPQE